MRTPRRTILLAAFAGLPLGAACLAQDSVAAAPGQSDAISALDLDLQRVRYVVDLSPAASAWGAAFGVAPIMKATRSIDPAFSTQILGAAALSSGQRSNVTMAATAFPLWNAAGQGVNPDFNQAPGDSVSKTGFSRVFGVAFSDFGLETADQTLASAGVGAIVGQDASNPTRLYVERTTALVSRNDVTEPDSSSISLGGVDQGGNVALRVDDFNASLGFANVKGENTVIVALPERSVTPGQVGSLNFLVNLSGSPTGPNAPITGGAGTRFLVNNGTTTLNTPAVVFSPIAPGFLLGSGVGVSLDFRGRFTFGRESTTTVVSTNAHFGPGVAGLRGNPTYSVLADVPGSPTAGTIASLAIPAGSTRATILNAFGVNAPASAGEAITVAPGSAVAATLPAPITGPDGYTANPTGAAEFSHYLSQVSFRGPSGQVGVGRTAAGDLVLAAVATESSGPTSAREFLAVATRNASGGFDWTVAAHPGKAVLSAPPTSGSSAPIGTIAFDAPASISSPAVDTLGNLYFVAAWDDARPAGSPGPGGESGPGRKTGLFRAVRDGAGQYTLDLLLCTGQTLAGANSQTPWTITRLTLADADSIASGGFHGGQILHGALPGFEPANPVTRLTAGGLVVNATIAYDRAGQDEPYE
ncbi:MAG: hypothetical protein ACTS27_00700, partial [Phycisphaerales bacterium]